VGASKDVYINALRLLRFISRSQTRGRALFHQDESYIVDPSNAQGEGLWTFKTYRKREVRTEDAGPMTGIITSRGWDVNNLTPAQEAQLLGVAQQAGISGVNTNTEALTLFKSEVKAIDSTTRKQFTATVPTQNVDPLSIQKIVYSDQVLSYASGEYLTHGDKFYELMEKGYYTYHYNYPIIVKNMIFNNMWIETVQFTHDSKDGIDAIRGHILLRKYMRPPEIRWSANGFNQSNLVAIENKIRTLYSSSQQIITVDKTDVNSGDVSNTSNQTTKATEGYKATTKPDELKSADKKVWVWEEKRNNTPQMKEILTGLVIGAAKLTMRLAMAPNHSNAYMSTFSSSVNIPRVIASQVTV